jgi:CHRD domain-containing protein
MTRRLKIGIATAAFAALAAGSLMANDRDDDRGRQKSRFFVHATLEGYQEVPAISSTGTGKFRAWVDTVANTITWKLSYDALEGDVAQAHVHFGQMTANGGISFFLCTNLGNGPAGTQLCPAGPAELTGVITADLVTGPAGNGIEAGAFAEIAAAIRNGTAYANVHSSKWPAGEIRGQLH